VRVRGMKTAHEARPSLASVTGTAEISSESWTQFAALSGTP